LKTEKSQKEIAKDIGVSESTVSRANIRNLAAN